MWILVAVVGAVLVAVGLARLVRRYSRGEIRLRYLLAVLLGVCSVAAFAIVDALNPANASKPLALSILLPGIIAVVVILREHRGEEPR